MCARRRLRAGKDQIVAATRAAKSKRVELESLILDFEVAANIDLQYSRDVKTATPKTAQRSPTSRYIIYYCGPRLPLTFYSLHVESLGSIATLAT